MVRLLLPIPETPPSTLTVEGPRFHYLSRVLRAAVGDALEVFDGRGRAFEARVTSLSPDCAELALLAPRPSRLPRPIYLLQGLPKADKMEGILQKATELGASGFFPVETKRCVVQLDTDRAEKKQQRWQRIVEEAARQCRRADVPVVAAPGPLEKATAALPGGTAVWVLDEEEKALSLSQAFAATSPEAPIAFVIGPEGGLTREEVAGLVARGAVPVTLGARILRTETASLAALSVLLHLSGELG